MFAFGNGTTVRRLQHVQHAAFGHVSCPRPRDDAPASLKKLEDGKDETIHRDAGWQIAAQTDQLCELGVEENLDVSVEKSRPLVGVDVQRGVTVVPKPVCSRR